MGARQHHGSRFLIMEEQGSILGAHIFSRREASLTTAPGIEWGRSKRLKTA